MPVSLAETDAALAEERRLLYVGVTRAREHLVLVGCPGVLEKAPQYKKLLEHVHRLGGYLGPDTLNHSL